MSRLADKRTGLVLRKQRVRHSVKGTAQMPRLSVFISNQQVTAQIIDDEAGFTICSITTVGNKTLKGNKTEKAKWVGSEISKIAKAKKIKKVVLDRNGKLYHGRVKELADAAREGGLEL